MSVDLAVVLLIINIVGLLIIGHVVRYIWTWQTIHNRNWCLHITALAATLLFSGAVAANTFISAVYRFTP